MPEIGTEDGGFVGTESGGFFAIENAITLMSAIITQTLPNIVNLTCNAVATLSLSDLSIQTTGPALSITSIILGNGTTTPKLSLSRKVLPTETITISSTGGDLGALSNGPVTNNVKILYSNDFAGNIIDTEFGTVTNPDAANLTILQNDSLQFKRTTDTTVASLGNYWRAISPSGSFTRGVFSGFLNRASGYTVSTWLFRVMVDNSNYIDFYNGGGGLVRANIVIGGVSQFDQSMGQTLGANSFKIIYADNNDISFWYWSGSAWTQVGTTQNFNIGSTVLFQMESQSSASDAAGNVFSFDGLRVCTQDFTTQVPDDFFA